MYRYDKNIEAIYQRRKTGGLRLPFGLFSDGDVRGFRRMSSSRQDNDRS